MLTSTVALHLTAALGSVAVIIDSLELLAKRKLLADSALASWPVARTSSHWLSSGLFQRTVGWLLEYPRVLALVAIRIPFAVLLILGVYSVNTVAAVIVALSTLLVLRRSPFGTDGADQMTFLTFASLALAFGIGHERAEELVLWFLAVQACVAYFTAGAAKLISPAWRRGDALQGILGTEMYGHMWAHRVLSRHPYVGTVMCWSVIVLECSFPLVLLGVTPLMYALLIAGASFHIGAAILMRLNTFLWAFVATYPAIAFCAQAVSLPHL